MKKRITIELPVDAYKALSIEAIERGLKIKILLEQVIEKEAKKVIKSTEKK